MIIKYLKVFIPLLLFLGFSLQNLSAQKFPTNKPIIDKDTTFSSSDTIVTNPNTIDAPVYYTAKDSMIMELDGRNMICMFGESSIQYKNLDLTGECIELNADSNIIFSTFALDSLGEEFGYPIFKEGETQYEMKKARYNFKTKKMFVNDVITKQDEGYVTASKTKKMPNDDLYMRNGRYTTCDEHDHPHFYFQLTKAKVQSGKRIVTGPVYLVVEDVPLPVALPFCFFPFSGNYSSGIIMPSYDEEMARGFSLRNGGYYFAFNNYIDLSLTGEIFSKGSWGLDANSTYKKRYKASGKLQASYRVTIIGEKEERDYSKSKDIKLSWTHNQDEKANPFSTLSASVNLSTSSYNKNDLGNLYSDQYTQNFKSSSINYSYRPPNSLFSFNVNASVNQTSQNATLNLALPNLTITMRDIYPFRKKEQIGILKWYENIRVGYTGLISNSIQNVKEDELFKKNLIKDWKNGMKHNIPISSSFSLFKNITVTPSINYIERWYFSRINQKYDSENRKLIATDTIYSFYRIYNYSANISVNTKLYGLFKPWGLWGKWTKNTQIRHVFTPSVSLSGAPDFSDIKYGFYKRVPNNKDVIYSPFAHNLWSVPGRGKSGTMNFSLDNNLEMKIPINQTDSVRKISLIDNLRLEMSYNFLADSMNWSDINVSTRFKFGKYTLGIQGIFDTYTYNEQGARINTLRWNVGKGIGRLKSTGTSFSYDLNNETVKKWLKKNEEKNPSDKEESTNDDVTTNGTQQNFLRKTKTKDTNYDDDGYFPVDIPWNLNFYYSLSLDYNMTAFDSIIKEYPYQVNQILGISGNINPTKNWSLNFDTNYDFDRKKFNTLMCSISRQMHCWTMSASIIPIGPYQSYHFSISVNSSMLKDIKYTQSSNFRDSVEWGD